MNQMRTVEDDIGSPIVAHESLALKKTGAGGIDALSDVLGEILNIMRLLAIHLHVHVGTADALGNPSGSSITYPTVTSDFRQLGLLSILLGGFQQGNFKQDFSGVLRLSCLFDWVKFLVIRLNGGIRYALREVFFLLYCASSKYSVRMVETPTRYGRHNCHR